MMEKLDKVVETLKRKMHYDKEKEEGKLDFLNSFFEEDNKFEKSTFGINETLKYLKFREEDWVEVLLDEGNSGEGIVRESFNRDPEEIFELMRDLLGKIRIRISENWRLKDFRINIIDEGNENIITKVVIEERPLVIEINLSSRSPLINSIKSLTLLFIEVAKLSMITFEVLFIIIEDLRGRDLFDVLIGSRNRLKRSINFGYGLEIKDGLWEVGFTSFSLKLMNNGRGENFEDGYLGRALLEASVEHKFLEGKEVKLGSKTAEFLLLSRLRKVFDRVKVIKGGFEVFINKTLNITKLNKKIENLSTSITFYGLKGSENLDKDFKGWTLVSETNSRLVVLKARTKSTLIKDVRRNIDEGRLKELRTLNRGRLKPIEGRDNNDFIDLRKVI